MYLFVVDHYLFCVVVVVLHTGNFDPILVLYLQCYRARMHAYIYMSKYHEFGAQKTSEFWRRTANSVGIYRIHTYLVSPFCARDVSTSFTRI